MAEILTGIVSIVLSYDQYFFQWAIPSMTVTHVLSCFKEKGKKS